MMDYNNYCFDIALCIDKTGNMRMYSDSIREFLLSIPSKLHDKALMGGYNIKTLRIKIITFGDYRFDRIPMTESSFFVIPEQNDELLGYLDSINYGGGGDIPENGFEALATAIKSDWTTDGDTRRHVILMISNGPALPLGERADCDNYPDDLPKNIDELSAWWYGFDTSFDGTFSPRHARLIAFVPQDEDSWSKLEEFDRVILYYYDEIEVKGINVQEISKIILSEC